MEDYILFNGDRYVRDGFSDYYVLLHDQHTEEWNFRPRSLFLPDDGLSNKLGYPEMVPCQHRYLMPLTERIQWAWFELCVYIKHRRIDWWNLSTIEQNLMATQWSTLTDSKRFATNHSGTDQAANYIKNEIMGEPLKSGLPRQSSVLCGGNLVKRIGNHLTYFHDEPYIQIEVWNGITPSPNALMFNWLTHPHLIHLATISTPFMLNGQLPDRPNSYHGPWRVDPFPFFDGRGSPYYVYSNSPQYVPLNRVKRLKWLEVRVSPYIP